MCLWASESCGLCRASFWLGVYFQVCTIRLSITHLVHGLVLFMKRTILEQLRPHPHRMGVSLHAYTRLNILV